MNWMTCHCRRGTRLAAAHAVLLGDKHSPELAAVVGQLDDVLASRQRVGHAVDVEADVGQRRDVGAVGGDAATGLPAPNCVRQAATFESSTLAAQPANPMAVFEARPWSQSPFANPSISASGSRLAAAGALVTPLSTSATLFSPRTAHTASSQVSSHTALSDASASPRTSTHSRRAPP